VHEPLDGKRVRATSSTIEALPVSSPFAQPRLTEEAISLPARVPGHNRNDASAPPGTRAQRGVCLAAGMDGVITKPLNHDRLNAALADLAIRPCGVKRISQNLCKSPGICHKSVPGQ
jgi:hypothetical protein